MEGKSVGAEAEGAEEKEGVGGAARTPGGKAGAEEERRGAERIATKKREELEAKSHARSGSK